MKGSTYIHRRLANKKANTAEKLLPVLAQRNELLLSFGILPLKLSQKDKDLSQKLKEDCEKRLNKLRYDYFYIKDPAKGLVSLFFILNINYSDLEYLADCFNQNSIIYAEKEWDKTMSDASFFLAFLKKERRKKEYFELQTILDRVSLLDQSDLFFNNQNLAHFQISSSIIADHAQKAQNLLEIKYAHVEKDTFFQGILENIYTLNYTVKHRWTRRCFLYESEKNKLERLQRIWDRVKDDSEHQKHLPDEVYEYLQKGLIY